jgi:hypothetical protein
MTVLLEALKRAACWKPDAPSGCWAKLSLLRASHHSGLPCGSSVSSLRPPGGCEKAGRRSSCRGRLSGERWRSLAESVAVKVRKENVAVDRLASKALAVAGGVDSLQSCPLDVSGAVFRNVSVAVTD